LRFVSNLLISEYSFWFKLSAGYTRKIGKAQALSHALEEDTAAVAVVVVAIIGAPPIAPGSVVVVGVNVVVAC